MRSTTVYANVTRLRKLVAELESGLAQNEATDVMIKINAITLKLDRAGWTAIADEFQAAKRAALEVGRVARQARLQAEVTAARTAHRDALAAAPAKWTRR
jgi:hypothetical protein